MAERVARHAYGLSIACLPVGIAISVWSIGSFGLLTQWLEAGAVVGYLIGNNLLARNRASGYLWFIFMHLSCAWLMWIEHYPLLFWMQIASLGFIADAYRASLPKKTARS